MDEMIRAEDAHKDGAKKQQSTPLKEQPKSDGKQSKRRLEQTPEPITNKKSLKLEKDKPVTDNWEWVQDMYVCDPSAFRILTDAMNKEESGGGLRDMLNKGYLFVCVLPMDIHEKKLSLPTLPPNWGMYIPDRWIDYGHEWHVLLEPFASLINSSEDPPEDVTDSLRALITLSQSRLHGGGSMIFSIRLIFTTGNTSVYKYLTTLQDTLSVPQFSSEGFSRLPSRVWNVAASLDPREQVWIRKYPNFKLDDREPGEPRRRRWNFGNTVTPFKDTYVCDGSAFQVLEAAAFSGALQGRIYTAVYEQGSMYRIVSSPNKLSKPVPKRWKVWAVTDQLAAALEEEAFVRSLREVLSGEEVDKVCEQPCMMESMREFVAACGEKRNDKFPTVLKQLLVFCTGNREFYELYLADRRGLNKLEQLVELVCGKDAREIMIVKAWDVSRTLLAAGVKFIKHPGWAEGIKAEVYYETTEDTFKSDNESDSDYEQA